MELLKQINEEMHLANEQIVAMMNEYERRLDEAEEKANELGKPLTEYLKERFDTGQTEYQGQGKARAGEAEWLSGMQGGAEKAPMMRPPAEQARTGPQPRQYVIVRNPQGMARYRVTDRQGGKVSMEKIRSGLPGEQNMPPMKDYDMLYTNFELGRDPMSKDAVYFVKER